MCSYYSTLVSKYGEISSVMEADILIFLYDLVLNIILI
jgi:hypothetical protein